MIPPIVLPIIARILNQYLKLDEEMHGRLEAYNDRVMRICITTFEWTFFMKIHQGHLELMDNYQGPIDATLRASISDLTKAAIQEKPTVSTSMEVGGDTALLQAVTTIFKQVDIDWEELLAKTTGDTIARGMGNLIRETKAFHDKIFATKKENMTEYLQEEVQLLSHPVVVEGFCNDVDDFRDEIERIEARITLLRQRIEEN